MAQVKKPKWYVVWTGHVPGVYTSWDVAQRQISGYPKAQYKSYESAEEAQQAFAEGPIDLLPTTSRASSSRPRKPSFDRSRVVLPSISVDAACNMTTGVMEYRGVDTETEAEFFLMGPYEDCSNNLGEFLAIVHALAHCKKHDIALPIYSDSRTAIAWVRNRHAKTTVERTPKNARVFELIKRAEEWLSTNSYVNHILKWETEQWGENPADFGRK